MAAPTIVVAEDDSAIRELLAHHLEREGFSVVAVGDGQAALRSARHAADLVILDIGLPGIDGYEVATLLREDAGLVQPTLIALTGYGQEADRRRALTAGFDMHLTKPVNPEHLKRVLAQAGVGT